MELRRKSRGSGALIRKVLNAPNLEPMVGRFSRRGFLMLIQRSLLLAAVLAFLTPCAPAFAQYGGPGWQPDYPPYQGPPAGGNRADDDDEDAALLYPPQRQQRVAPPRLLPPPPPFFPSPFERRPAAGYEQDRPSGGYDPGVAPRPPGGIDPRMQPPDQFPGRSAGPRPTQPQLASLPPEDQPELGASKELPPQFKRQMVDYATREPAGTLVIDTTNTFLYLVLGNGRALRYGIGVGREGFSWAGAERVSRMAEWPDWHPPAEMIERQPYLPRFMAGGEGNPLGARALYLGKTLYRIHGTNQPSTIGTFVSSGCIRLTNSDIEDLYNRVQVGARVVVLQGPRPPATAAN
jgi:lipoprotein-anchoring transpeptidase ErfK/SrfK